MYLFEEREFSAHTVATCKAALKEPLSLAFDIDTSDSFFSQFLKGMRNRRPSSPYRAVTWSLDKVLEMLITDRFNIKPSLEFLLQKIIFLVARATGGRVSEINALEREAKYVKFTVDSVNLSLTPIFYARLKTLSTAAQQSLITPSSMRKGCHTGYAQYILLRSFLKKLHQFLQASCFFDKRGPCSKLSVASHMCNLIGCSQPKVCPSPHEVRKMATSTTDEVCGLVFNQNIL